MADRIRLDGDVVHFPRLPERFVNDLVAHVRLRRAEMALEESEATFIRFGRPFETGASKLRGGDPRGARPSRVDALVPRALLQEFLASRCRAACEALRHDEL